MTRFRLGIERGAATGATHASEVGRLHVAFVAWGGLGHARRASAQFAKKGTVGAALAAGPVCSRWPTACNALEIRLQNGACNHSRSFTLLIAVCQSLPEAAISSHRVTKTRSACRELLFSPPKRRLAVRCVLPPLPAASIYFGEPTTADLSILLPLTKRLQREIDRISAGNATRPTTAPRA